MPQKRNPKEIIVRPEQIQETIIRPEDLAPANFQQEQAVLRPGQGFLSQATGLLPTIGGTLGAVAGVPLALPTGGGSVVGGGIAGAGGGEALRQIVNRLIGLPTPETSEEAAGQISKGMAGGALSEFGGAALGRIGGKIGEFLKGRAQQQMAGAMAVGPKPIKGPSRSEVIAQRRAPEILERGLTFPQMQKQAPTKIAELGSQIGAAETAAAKQKVEVAPILSSLDKLRSHFFIKGTSQVKPGREAALKQLDQYTENLGAGRFKSVSRESLLDFKRSVDDLVSATGPGHQLPAEGKFTLAVQRKTANAIRRQLHTERPDIEALDAEFSFWKDIERLVLEASRVRRPGFISPGPLVAGTAGGALVGGAGGAGFMLPGVAGGLTFGVVLPTARRLFGSPAWKTISAVEKNKLADFMAKGRFEEANKLMLRMLLTRPSQEQRE